VVEATDPGLATTAREAARRVLERYRD